MQRSLGIFVLGLLLGGLIGYALHRPARNQVPPAERARSSRAAESVAGNAADERRAEDEKILLGDITTVPFQEVYEVLARQSAEEMARLAQQLDGLPPSPQNTARLRTFFKAWAQLDPAAAFAKANALQTRATRETALEATIAGSDPAGAATLASSIAALSNENLSATAKANLFGQALQKWSEVDPAAAARLLSETKREGMELMMAFYGVAQSWAERDPAAALAWAQEQPQPTFGISPVNGAIRGWWKKDPAGAEAFVLAQAGTPLGKQLIGNLASQMAEQDHEKAARWANQISDKDLRKQAYSTIAGQLAFSDPKAAGEWALSLSPDAIPSAVETVASMWGQADPTAAAHWLEGLSGSTRDSAVSSFSFGAAETDPATATAWAATISDETKRLQALRHTTSQWLRRDPAAARAWIQNSSLGETAKTSLLASPTPAPP